MPHLQLSTKSEFGRPSRTKGSTDPFLFTSRYQRILATCRLHYLLALVKPSSWTLPKGVNVAQYCKLPPPPMNEFIRKREKASGAEVDNVAPPPAIPARHLLAHLLDARQKAKVALSECMESLGHSEKDSDRRTVEWLRTMGADIGPLQRN